MIPVLFSLSLRQAISIRRLLLLALVALIPFLIVAPVLLTGNNDDGTFIDLFTGLVVSIILPMIVIILATGAFGNELEDRTLSLLTTRPVPRSYIVFAKLAATVVVAAPMAAVPAAVLVALDPSASSTTIAATIVGSLICVVAYSSIFTWTGLMTQRALAFAVVYVFLWEGFATSLLEGLRYVSVRGYTFAILHGIDNGGFSSLEEGIIELQAGMVGAAAAIALFFAATVYRLRRMDVP
ncbi:MAG: ABC transporter permease [Chloroflexota bacterium]|nr:ABC transporter permease [Chloroflexota bacterium]MDE2941959.1 ABC transporter permease [Chloroflexota bacterium]MDE3268604.1 ABC transporter permease [Chloroflexota bacterium]